jgi:zinc transporter 1/2/3
MVNAVNVRRYALAPYVLALVLSVHSIIAGIALGAESSAITSAALFIAIMAHKGVAGFALGVSLRRAHIKRPRAVGLIAFFATMTPLGIAVGAVLGALLSGRGAEWFEGIFDALAAGTFLYIAVIDIVESEFAKQGDAGAKFAMVLLGIAVMALIAVWT